MPTMKNRDILPIGTRVKLAYAKLSWRVGTVVEHSEDGTHMMIKWDDQPYPSGSYMSAEVRPVREDEKDGAGNV